MDDDQWTNRARNSSRYLPRQHSRESSPLVGASAGLESTERGGARAMLFSNSISAPWPGTAISGPQEYESQSSELRPTLHVDLFSSATHAPDATYMNDDNRTVDPRYLTLRPPDTQVLHQSRFEHGNANFNPTGTSYSGPYDETTLRPPFSYAFEGHTIPCPSPTTLTTPSSAGTSYSHHMIEQEAFYSPMNIQNEAIRNEEYQAYQSRVMPQTPLEANFPYMASNVAHWPAGHDASYYTEHPRGQVRTWSDVYDEESAMQPTPSRHPANTPHGMYQNAQTPVASGSSLTTRAPSEWTTDTSSRTGSSSSAIRPRRRERSVRPRTLTSTYVSTGDAFGTHMYNHELVPSQTSPFAQSGAHASGSSMSPTIEFPAASPAERVRRANKEKLILHEEQEDDQPTNEPSSSTSMNLKTSAKAKVAPNPHTRKMKKTRTAPDLRRAQSTRPREIVCPLADCGQPISNTFGSIQQHVDACRSSSARAVREAQLRRTEQAQAQARGSMSKSSETPAKIRCPTCPRRTFASLRRWADHLRDMHGEWVTYRCNIVECADVFLCVKDRDQHMRAEH